MKTDRGLHGASLMVTSRHKLAIRTYPIVQEHQTYESLDIEECEL